MKHFIHFFRFVYYVFKLFSIVTHLNNLIYFASFYLALSVFITATAHFKAKFQAYR